MKIHEYQAKAFLKERGIPVPEGRVAQSPAEAQAIAQELGGTVMIKAQVLVGGRGKAGGVKMAKTPQEAAARARDILGMTIKGIEVKQVLVAQRRGHRLGVLREPHRGQDGALGTVHRERLGGHGDRGGRGQGAGEDRPLCTGSRLRASCGSGTSMALARAFPGADLAEQAWAIVSGMYRLFSE